MEIDITEFFNSETVDMSDISGSVMEHGPNAARITWNNAREASKEYRVLDSVEKDEAAREFLAGFGAWTREEIDAWDDNDLNALILQFIAGDIRETPDMDVGDWDWGLYQRLAMEGAVAGRMYRGDDGRVYYYLGS